MQLYKCPSYDVAATYIPINDDYFGTTSGYGRAELNFTKGIVYDATFCLILAWNMILDNPYPSLPRGNYLETTDGLNLVAYMIQEKVVYGL